MRIDQPAHDHQTANRRFGSFLVALAVVSTCALTSCDTGGGSTNQILEKLDQIDARLSKVEEAVGTVEGVSATKVATGAVTPGTATGTKVAETEAEGTPATGAGTTGAGSTGAGSTGAGTTGTPKVALVPGPSVVAVKPDHDFGQSWAGPVLAHEFVLRNVGDAPLLITNVKPACGCTSAGLHPKSIAPGAEGKFPFNFKTERFKGATSKNITITTNDPKNKTVVLSIRGIFKPSIDYRSFVVIRAKPGEGPMKEVVTITNHRSDAPLALTLQPIASKFFQASLRETKPGELFELEIAVNPPYQIGYEREAIKLKTNRTEQPTLEIRANLHVPDRLELVPVQLVVNKTGTRIRHLTLSNYGESPVHLLSATVDDPAITTEIRETEAGKKYSVVATFPTNYTPPPTGRTLTLVTDDPEKPEFKVPIRSLTPTKRSTTTPRKRPAEEFVGKAAPSFSLETVDGRPLDMGSLADSPATILNFFAPNCGFCKKQIPMLERVRERYQSQGIRFVNVSERMRRDYTQDQVLSILGGIGSNLEVSIDQGNVTGRAFKATSYPTMVVVDRNGTVRHVTVGAKANLETLLSSQLDALIESDG